MTKKPDFKKLKKGFLKYAPKWLALMAPLFMLISLPVLNHWIKETDEIYLYELFIPLILASITSFFISVIFFRIFLKNRFLGYAGALTATVLLGPGYPSVLKILSKLGLATSGGKFALTYVIAVILFSFFISFETYLHFKKWLNKTDVLAKSIFIVIIVAFSIQLFWVAKIAFSTKSQSSYHPPDLPGKLSQEVKDKPDIYYIVLDRYTSDAVLKEQFGYDNSDFTNFLKSNEFYVKEDAYSAYPFTPFSVPSTLNADYHSDLVEKFQKISLPKGKVYHDSVHHNAVAKKLKGAGYKYYQIGTPHEPTSQAPLADEFFQPNHKLTIFNKDFDTTVFIQQEVSKTIYSPFLSRGLMIGKYKILSLTGDTGRKGILAGLQYFKELTKTSSGGKFVFAHFLLPHDPYYFNADGTFNKYASNNNVGKPVKEKYIDQVKFINSQIMEVVSTIRKNSKGKAVVILQADEGGRPGMLNLEEFEKTDPAKSSILSNEKLANEDMRKWSDKDIQMTYGILAAYHMPKVKKEDMDKYMNSVNVFRLVFNNYFGYNLPYLLNCHYTFPKGTANIFTYTDITKRLTGKDNPACAQDSNFNKK